MKRGTSLRRSDSETPSRGVSLQETGSSSERAEGFERMRVLQAFRPLAPQDALAEVDRYRSRSLQPERSLWDAVELMMRDEALRDRLLTLMHLPDKEGSVRQERAKLYTEYRKTLAGYQALVELADTSADRSLATREIIPHTHLGQLRLRVADLLANIPFYFPEEEHTLEDKQQAFRRLSEAFEITAADGLKAEMAVVGLLRYGPEWLQGKDRGEERLSPTMFIEHTMPREDVLRSTASGLRRAGQFNGHDLIYNIPEEKKIRSVQIKTGEFENKPSHVNLSASAVIRGYEQVARSAPMRGMGKLEVPGVFERARYYGALEEIITAFPFGDATQADMRDLFTPSVPRPVRETPPPGWTVSLGAMRHMLGANQVFQAFAQRSQREEMSLPVNAENFRTWANFLTQARATHPEQSFWDTWSDGSPPKPLKPSSRRKTSSRASSRSLNLQ